MPKHIGTTQEVSLFTDSVTHRLMEVIVKAHFLLASALFVFVQITAPQAQGNSGRIQDYLRSAFDGETCSREVRRVVA